ncbi:hypothetical protein ON010_g5571 [Phytophthora cinnamomi]|nr:hypothetical protein ON010_g5571 [Phytophthora cinnamomi]
MKVKLKRFTKKQTKKQQAAPRAHSRQVLRPLDDERFVWRSLAEIRTAQQQKQAPVCRFGVPPVWVSDNGSLFKNEVVAELSKRLKSQQTFTLAYSPWINDSVERVNRRPHIPLLQSSINHTAVPSLDNRAPVELFTVLPCPSPLAECYRASAKKLVKFPGNSAAISKHLAALRNNLHKLHQPIADQRLKQRLLNKKRERGENVVNFDVGDYVLRSRVDEKRDNKLLVSWQGPYTVVRGDAHSFRVRHLVTGDELDVHPSRLKFYVDSSLHVTEEILEHMAFQDILLAISELKKHRWSTTIKYYEILES